MSQSMNATGRPARYTVLYRRQIVVTHDQAIARRPGHPPPGCVWIEYSIITDGEIGFRSGDREFVLGAGRLHHQARGEMRTMWNAGSVPAR